MIPEFEGIINKHFKILSTGVDCSSTVPILYPAFLLLWPRCRTLHLSALNFICHLFDQSTSLVRSACSSIQSCSVRTRQYTLVSSAKICAALQTMSGRSFINSTNNIGPRTLPCGMPLSTFSHVDRLLFTTTRWVCPVQNALIQSYVSQSLVRYSVKRFAEIEIDGINWVTRI